MTLRIEFVREPYNPHLGVFDDENLVLRHLVALQPSDELCRLAGEHGTQDQLDLSILKLEKNVTPVQCNLYR